MEGESGEQVGSE